MSKCKAKTEVYSRIVGYYRPVQQWNPGKQSEFKDRVPFKIGSEAGWPRTPAPPAARTIADEENEFEIIKADE